MSDNSDIGWEVQQQEEEKAKDDSSSSKTPMQTATTDHTESGDTSRTRRPGKETVREETASVNHIYHSPSTKIDAKKFLFKMRVTDRDVVRGRLFIPVEKGLDHFRHTPVGGKAYEVTIKIYDLRNHHWFMKKTYDPFECGYVINSKWREFSVMHNLEAEDVLYFYKPFPPAPDNHYLVIVFKRHEYPNSVPQFKQENYVFQRELTRMDVNFWLSLPKEDVITHFPAVRIPAATHKVERLCFTDARNKDWRMDIKFFTDDYMLAHGWDKFVEEYKLEIGDVIRFYKPVHPFDSHHFLIQHVKKSEPANKPAEPGTGSAGKDGSGAGKGGEKQQGERAGALKGKKFSAGQCCMA